MGRPRAFSREARGGAPQGACRRAASFWGAIATQKLAALLIPRTELRIRATSAPPRPKPARAGRGRGASGPRGKSMPVSAGGAAQQLLRKPTDGAVRRRLSRPRNLRAIRRGLRYERTGGDLLSQGVAPQVPSALKGLTALFGMGRGVSLSLCATGNFARPPRAQSARRDRPGGA